MEDKVLEAIEQKFKELTEKQVNDFISTEAYNKGIEEIKSSLKEMQENTELKAELEKITKFAEELNATVEAMKETSSEMKITNRSQAIQKAVKDITGSDAYKMWSENGFKGEAPKVTVKYDITSDRTGNDLITTQSTYVQSNPPVRSFHVRDLFKVLPTDLPYLVFDKVTSWTNAADVNTENGVAGEIDMKTAEETVDIKRLAGFMDVSKRAMKSVVWLNAFLNKHLPEKIKNVEDFQIIFGDGAGNNLDGVYKNAQTFDLTGPSFAATAVASVATYNAGTQTLVTFAANHNLKNGYKITFASATESTYNATFTVQVKSPTVLLVDVAYVAEADTSAWTATTTYWLADSVDNAQEADVLMSTRSFLANGEYQVTGHVINPADAGKMELFKETTNGYIASKKIERVNGVLYVGGIPCVETNAMPPGKFLSGDFNMAVELLQFQELTLSFISDTTYAKANKVMALIEEEILLPIYNPYMFVSGTFAAAMTALETP